MCIAFDGAYILEAPPADPGVTDENRPGATQKSQFASADQAVDDAPVDRFDLAPADLIYGSRSG